MMFMQANILLRTFSLVLVQMKLFKAYCTVHHFILLICA